MTKVKILQKNAPILRETANPVPIKDIKSKKIQEILGKMKTALHAEEDGAAIAAPQIGKDLRMFIVNGELFASEDLVFINPEIVKASKKKKKMEEGCLSIRYLYGQVKRSEKVTVRAYNEKGLGIERGASGLLAQIFQHETDHLNGILFTDKAENIKDLPPPLSNKSKIKFVFFGSLPDGKAGSQFSGYVLEELKKMGFSPMLNITSAKEDLPLEKLRKLNADVFVVASFGKILSPEVLNIPKHKVLNVHPSLLPRLRGPAPIQNSILSSEEPGITIIRLDEKMDHGPILMQKKIPITPWPDHYRIVEKKLGHAGGKMIGELLPKWVKGELQEIPQDDSTATYIKLIKKEDGLLDLNDQPEKNLRKVLAYSTWPGAYMFFKNKRGKEIRLVVKDAKIKDPPAGEASGQFSPIRVIPAGKREMDWQDFLRGN